MIKSSRKRYAVGITAGVIVLAIGAIIWKNVTSSSQTGKLLWGVYLGESDGDLTHNGNLAAFEQQVGKPVNIQAVFVNWNSNFPSDVGANLKPNGQTLWIYWLPNNVSLDDIIAGNADSYIESFAMQAKTYGGSVVLAPFHEMNGNWDPWGGTVGTNTPAKEITAWQHVHDIFAAADATNVKFAWVVNDGSVPNTPQNALEAYYPGSAYVDYVGVDGFNFGNPWETWDQVFPASVMAQLAAYDKPIFISSTGSDPGPNQAEWVTNMGIATKKYPQIVGWIWFDQSNGTDNFVITADTSTFAAFKAIVP